MNTLEFVRAAAENYFRERCRVWKNARRWWSFLLISFFALYMVQIYCACVHYELVAARYFDFIAPENFWRIQLRAMYFQGMVLLGVFIRFLAGFAGGKWAIRFAELGEFVAFFSLLGHFLWSAETFYPFGGHHGDSPPLLLGLPDPVIMLMMLFFVSLAIHKITLIFVVTWRTVRK